MERVIPPQIENPSIAENVRAVAPVAAAWPAGMSGVVSGGAARAVAAGVARDDSVSGGRFTAEEIVGVCRAWIPGGGWLHGPGKLGDGYCRRVEIWIFAAQRDFNQQFDGDVFAGAFCQVGNCDWARSCAGLPGNLFAAHVDVFVGGVRDCDCGVRSGGSAGIGGGAEVVVWLAAVGGRADYFAGCVAGAGAAGAGVPVDRDVCGDADCLDCGVLCVRDFSGAAVVARMRRRVSCRIWKFCGTARCCTSRSEFWAPR